MSQHHNALVPATSRRDFLKAASVAGIGAYVSGVASPAWSQSPNEKLNVAVVGVGGRGSANLGGVRGENIVAICDVDERSLAKAGVALPKAEKYVDFRKMLEQANIEAVVVSTPDHCHAPISAAAIHLGKHVYCEKPLTHSIYEARTIAKLAAEHKVATQMGNQLHSAGGYRDCVVLVQSGAIGEVREVHTWSNRPSWPQGIGRPTDTPPVPEYLNWDLWLGPAPERAYNPAYMPFKWRGWWDFGTGALGDMGCHIIDPAFWALKLEAPTSVVSQFEGATDETCPKYEIITYEFPARGELPPVTMTWWDGGKRPPAELAPGAKLPDNGVLYVGSKGTLLCPHGGVPQLLPGESFKDFEKPESFLPPTKGHHQDWIEACKGGPPASSNFAYAGPLTETVLLGNLASHVGKKLLWNAAEMKAEGVPEADQYIRREYRKGWSL